MHQLNILSAARTHPGAVRDCNEDAVLAHDAAGLWVVADGMGGHKGGRWASAMLVHALHGITVTGALDAAAINRTLAAANDEIARTGQSIGSRIGSTIAALHFDGSRLYGLWAGDSRIYRLNGTRLEQLTHDHSVVQELVDRGAILQSEAQSHPLSHVLSRAVGTHEGLRAESFAADVVAGDVFLLCSDGLSKVLTSDAIAARLASGDAASAADNLMADALACGAPDNVSVIVINFAGKGAGAARSVH